MVAFTGSRAGVVAQPLLDNHFTAVWFREEAAMALSFLTQLQPSMWTDRLLREMPHPALGHQSPRQALDFFDKRVFSALCKQTWIQSTTRQLNRLMKIDEIEIESLRGGLLVSHQYPECHPADEILSYVYSVPLAKFTDPIEMHQELHVLGKHSPYMATAQLRAGVTEFFGADFWDRTLSRSDTFAEWLAQHQENPEKVIGVVFPFVDSIHLLEILNDWDVTTIFIDDLTDPELSKKLAPYRESCEVVMNYEGDDMALVQRLYDLVEHRGLLSQVVIEDFAANDD